jgi:ATPase subunit of ABC transporter with duplicated ATPase domains
MDEFRESLFISEGEARNVLAKFLFRKDDVFKKVSSLSGGEKTRLRLCQLMQQDINLLILDEPTNHLDIESKEVLENALLNFEGTMLFISHDRYFINKIATRIFEVDNHKIKSYEGNYDDYRIEKDKRAKQSEIPVVLKQEKVTDDKEVYKNAVEERARIKRKQTLETKINELEKLIAAKDNEAGECGEDYVKANELYEQKQKLQEELDMLLEEWMGL